MSIEHLKRSEPVGVGARMVRSISEAAAPMVMIMQPLRDKVRLRAVTRKRLRLRTILAPKANGFTLLEIMVAVAILAISLVALMNFQGNTMITSGRAERITEATMLARMKIAEVELDLEKVQKRGEFPEEKSEEGNFEEPFERYKWRVTVKGVKLPAPVTGEEGSVQTLIGRQLTEEIGKTVRELTVEVLWEDMGEEQKIDVVTHIVKL